MLLVGGCCCVKTCVVLFGNVKIIIVCPLLPCIIVAEKPFNIGDELLYVLLSAEVWVNTVGVVLPT